MESILIVDDSLLQATALKNILEEEYHIYTCRSGEEAIKEAEVLLPSLILLDIVMKGIDGFETLIRLKKQASTKNIPVILISSLTDMGNEEKGLNLGAVDYIVKPFNASIVRARVRTHTQLYSFRRTFETLAMIDGLTGIPNRRYYDDQSSVEWFRAMHDKQPLSVGLLDVDYFKQFNDLYGHPKGDDVLVEVAHSITDCLHCPRGFAARYGGEEFIFLLPNTPGFYGEKSAWRICRKIEALRIPHQGAPGSVLTVSIGGITVVPSEEKNYVDYVQIVDNMLYRAKNGGRNTVVWRDYLS